jgi:hypothetical protein
MRSRFLLVEVDVDGGEHAPHLLDGQGSHGGLQQPVALELVELIPGLALAIELDDNVVGLPAAKER